MDSCFHDQGVTCLNCRDKVPYQKQIPPDYEADRLMGLSTRLATLEGFIKGFTEMLALRLESMDGTLKNLELKQLRRMKK